MSLSLHAQEKLRNGGHGEQYASSDPSGQNFIPSHSSATTNKSRVNYNLLFIVAAGIECLEVVTW